MPNCVFKCWHRNGRIYTPPRHRPHIIENGGIMRNGSVEGTKFAQPAALSHLIYGWFRLPALCLAYKAVYITIIELYTYYRSDSQRQALRTHWISTPLCSSQSCFT